MLSAIQYHFKASAFIRKNNIGWLYLFPFIITILVFYAGFSLTTAATDFTTDWLRLQLDQMEWLGSWSDAINTIVYWLLWIALRIALYFVMAYVGGSVILLLMTPLLTLASEIVAEKMGKSQRGFDWMQFAEDLGRAVVLAVKNGFIQISLTVGCFFLGFVPVIGFAAPFLLFAVNAYFYGFNFMDYSLERHHFSPPQSQQFVWNHRFSAMATGAPFALWLLVPFIGPMLSGFVALHSTVAATLHTEDRLIASS